MKQDSYGYPFVASNLKTYWNDRTIIKTDGERLDAGRLANYRKLLKEARYVGLNSKQLEREKINEMLSGFSSLKQARDYIKHKHKG